MKTKIEWTDATWNPVYGCRHGCSYCYARKIAFRFSEQFSRFSGITVEMFKNFEPVWMENNFQKEFCKNISHIFINSMSDVAFWEQDWFDKVIKKAMFNPDKKFLFLTKRPDKVVELQYQNCKNSDIDIIKPGNIFFGKTITKNDDIDGFSFDFYSIEPIQERIDMQRLYGWYIKQIIVGAETGNRKGKIIPKAEWIEEIREFCQKNGIKLFEKDSLKSIVKRDLIQERI